MIGEVLNLKIIKGLIFASFFAPILIVNYFFFPFIVPKAIFFQVLIEVALFFYILLVISNKSYLPKMDILAKSVLLFFGVYLIAGIFGENVFRSFFGTFERMLGVFNLAHFVVLFFILRAVFTNKKDWIKLFRVFLFAGVIVGLYGFGQKLGISSLYNEGTNRIDSTIGNAAFFAAYMIFNTFFAMALMFIDRGSKFFNYFYKFSFIIGILGIYLSETRGAILGAFFAFLFLAGAWLLHNRKNIKFSNIKSNKGLAWIFGFFAIIIILFFVNKDILLDPLKRIGSISLNDTTTKTRILAAGVSWNGFLERPLLGWGPENYNLVFDKYYDPGLYPAEEWFDHAHNIIFDNLISAGAFGLLSYLFLLGVVIYLLFCYGKLEEENFIVSRIFMALILAYFLQNLFVFDALATYLPFFILLAFVGFLSTGEKSTYTGNKSGINPASFGVLLITLIAVVYFFNIKPAMAAHYITNAIITSPNYSDDALKNFKKAFDFALQGKPEISSRMMDYAINLSRNENISGDAKTRFAKKTIERAREAISEEPKNFRYYSYFTNAAFIDGENKELLKEIDAALDKITPLAKNKPTLHLQKYRVKALLGKNEEALSELKQAMDLYYDPDISIVLASSYRKIGDTKASIELLEKIFERGGIDLKKQITIAVELASMGENDKAITIIKKIMENNPDFKSDGPLFIKEIEKGRFLNGNFKIE